MAKPKEKMLARRLRKEGWSIRDIAIRLRVSKGTVSLWCEDIRLSEDQVASLHEKMVRGSYAGRMIGAQMQKDRKRRDLEECLMNARKEIGTLDERDLFLTGVALYWGEGAKKGSGTKFCNSSPNIIRFIMRWFREILEVEEERFAMSVTINGIHEKRVSEVVTYWSGVTGVPVGQFKKTILIKSKNKKVYENLSDHYGTLSIKILKGGHLLHRISGWMQVLGESRKCQGSSGG